MCEREVFISLRNACSLSLLVLDVLNPQTNSKEFNLSRTERLKKIVCRYFIDIASHEISVLIKIDRDERENVVEWDER